MCEKHCNTYLIYTLSSFPTFVMIRRLSKMTCARNIQYTVDFKCIIANEEKTPVMRSLRNPLYKKVREVLNVACIKRYFDITKPLVTYIMKQE